MKTNRITTIFKLLIFSTLALFSQDILGQNPLLDSKVKDMRDQVVDLSSYLTNGKPKIVSLWATWCGPCRMELNALKKVADRWSAEYDLEIVALSVDIPQMVERAKKMTQSNGWTYTFLYDHEQVLLSKLGVQGIPYSMLIDGKGNIVSVQVGYSATYEQELERKLKQL